MNKSDLIQKLADQMNLPRSKAELVINQIFDMMAKALMMGKRVELRGLFTFTSRFYPGHEGLNPRTGEKIYIKDKRSPSFKVGKLFKEQLEKL